MEFDDTCTLLGHTPQQNKMQIFSGKFKVNSAVSCSLYQLDSFLDLNILNNFPDLALSI